MFGSGSPSKPPPLTPAPPYQNAPPFQGADPQNSAFNSFVPQVSTPSQLLGGALGSQYVLPKAKKGQPPVDNSSEGILSRAAPWLGLNQAPTDAANMAQAEQKYLAFANQEQAQNASNLFVGGQGGSSYAAAQQGQEAGMNNFNAFQAGLSQQQADFQNVLAARNALYSQPIALGQQQNAANVARGLGISGLSLQESLGQNQYNLANTQGQNQYNLGVNGIANNYNSSTYGSQVGAQSSMYGSGLNFLGSALHTVVGNNGLI